MMLADLGAEVVKIEHPQGGDLERSGFPRGSDGEAYRFAMLNRNKRSVAIDLKSEEGVALFHELAKSADVVMEGFRPGVVESLGVGPTVIRGLNPGIVYASISGYGQDGPYADLPGHDINYLALAGLLRYFGGTDAPPRIPWLPIADIGGGATMAVAGVLAALLGRVESGQGDYLDLGMAEGALYWQQTRAQWYLATGSDPLPDGLPVTGALPGYGVYETADGGWLSLGCMEPVFWERLCSLLRMTGDGGRQHDPAAREELQEKLRSAIKERDRDEWFGIMREHSIPAAPCLSIAEALQNEHFMARGRLGGNEAHDRIRSPFHFSDSPRSPGATAPSLGADTDAVLSEMGLDVAHIADLRTRGVIR
jgi:crotonobetainyl-CoA:carnitine CoA-transferase CaiB-like acyl-CoA transferase